MPYTKDGTPYVATDTSLDAAHSIDSVAPAMRMQILAYVRGCDDGATCDEVEIALGMRHQTASARIRELVVLGLLVRRGDRRPTRSGRTARVYDVIHDYVIRDYTGNPLEDAEIG